MHTRFYNLKLQSLLYNLYSFQELWEYNLWLGIPRNQAHSEFPFHRSKHLGRFDNGNAADAPVPSPAYASVLTRMYTIIHIYICILYAFASGGSLAISHRYNRPIAWRFRCITSKPKAESWPQRDVYRPAFSHLAKVQRSSSLISVSQFARPATSQLLLQRVSDFGSIEHSAEILYICYQRRRRAGHSASAFRWRHVTIEFASATL